IGTQENPGEKLQGQHLNTLRRAALALAHEPRVINPVIKKYLKNRPFSTKMAANWDQEIKPTICQNLAQHIGRELTIPILVALHLAETSAAIHSDWKKPLQAAMESLNPHESTAEKLVGIKKYQELRKPSSKQDELFMQQYE